MTTVRPSDFLRVRLPPPRFTVSSPLRSHGSYTKISTDQVLACADFSVPTHWSIAPDLADRLIDAVSLDLDILLPQHPNLTPGLITVIEDLVRQWGRNFGETPREDHSKGHETATTEASRLLLLAVMDVFEVIERSTATAPDAVQLRRQQPPPSVPSCEMDHSLKRCSVSEGKPRSSCGVLETQISAPLQQPKWWIVANEGALYVGAYNIQWIVFASLTAFCVAHRSGSHMFWSAPLHNRRDEDDEFTAATVHPPTALSHIFGELMTKDHPGSEQCFPDSAALSFTPSPAASQSHPEFTLTGHDIDPDAEEHSASSKSDDSGDNYASSSGSERLLAPTPIFSGHHRFTGKWYGELRHPHGYTVNILHYLASGYQGSVYAGELLQNGQIVSAVAVKVSDDPSALLTEFRCYRALRKMMRDSIPRCYGLCVDSSTAYLITNLVPNHTPSRKLSKAERGAIYAALRKMHQAGWAHNDVVDEGSQSPRNLLWNSQGHPVLIDLESFTAFLHKKLAEERKSHLDICTGAAVTALDLNVGAEGQTLVRYVSFQADEPGAKVGHARARREVILCAGAIATPQILLLGGIGPKGKVKQPLKKELPGVGQNFQDHMATGILYSAPIEQSLHIIQASRLRAIVELFRYIAFGEGLFLSPVTQLRTTAPTRLPNLELMLIHFNCSDPRVGHPRLGRPLQRPACNLRFLSDPVDCAAMRKGLKLAKRIGEKMREAGMVLRDLHMPASEADADLDAFGEGGVVYDDLQVHGVANLRIADYSVVPEMMSTHLQAPAVMIAEWYADMNRLCGFIHPSTKE
ncbi:hypothetical protein C8J57DRAFT_1518308 [Mycena rebaudengoi]|nr:hypothetical protein C8J57DRAFT_1518308 [Mycena rebaudengoi]